jgi:branched-chain amino acid transport system ATP-binding protein
MNKEVLEGAAVTVRDAPAAAVWEVKTSSEDVILETRGVTKRFNGFAAVSDVSWHLRPGEAAGIIGPNGAGKTTLFNLLTGMFPPTEGHVRFRGDDVTRCSTHRRVRRGLVRTFQLVSVFDRLTVRENLVLAILPFAVTRAKNSRFFFGRSDSPEIVARCDEALHLVGLEAKATRPTLQLSYGEKRKLEIALALALRPVVLLLDEPFAGLSDGEIGEVLELIQRVKPTLSLVIIEHKISQIVDLVTRLSVMHEGRLIADGEPRDVLADPLVRQVYWGRA